MQYLYHVLSLREPVFIRPAELGGIQQVFFIKDKDPWIEKEKPSIVYNSKPSKVKGFTEVVKVILKHLWHAFYLSVNTFTTVGTGDIFATRLFRVLVLVEGALGWFMLGLFIVVFSEKFLR